MRKIENSFVVDTCALINLHLMGILELILDDFEFFVPNSVITELHDIAKHKDFIGKTSQELLKHQRKFQALDVSGGFWTTKGRGEFECSVIAREKNIPIITDDLEASKQLDKEEFTTYFSVFFLFYFAKRKKIPIEDALKRLEKIQLERNWQSNILFQTGKHLLLSLMD